MAGARLATVPQMKALIAIAVCACVECCAAQPDLWQHTRRQLAAGEGRPARVQRVSLPQPQQEAIIGLLKARNDCEACLPGDPTLVDNLSYGTVALSPGANVVLVEAGPGCARGGQGSNGAMWLVRFDASKTTLLATPREDFNGYVYSIEPTASKGYRDIILGWHMSAFEASLSYFRFDGKSYRRIGAATLRFDENGTSTLIPQYGSNHP